MEFYREQTRARHRPRVRGTTLSIRYFGGDNVIRPCVSAQCHRQCVRTAQQLAAQLHRVERTRYLIPLVFVTPNLSPRVTNRVYIYIRVVRSRLEIGSVSSSSFGIDRKIGSRDSSCGSHPPLLFASGSRYTFDSCNKGIRGRAIALRLLAPSRAAPWFSTVVENELGSDRSMDLSFDDRFEGRLSDSISRSRPLFSSLLFPARTSDV